MSETLQDALRKPLKLSEQTREQKLECALQGIASCATQCPCCEMHRQVANRALGYEVVITTDRITPPGLAAGENERCKVTPGCWLIKGHCD